MSVVPQSAVFCLGLNTRQKFLRPLKELGGGGGLLRLGHNKTTEEEWR